MKTTSTLLGAVIAAMVGVNGSAIASTIDLFNDPLSFGIHAAIDTTSGGGGVFQEFAGSSIIGGYRDLYAEVTAIGDATNPRTTLEVGGGGLSFSNNTGTTGIGIVQWDGQDNSQNLNPTGLRIEGVGANLINQVGCSVTGCDTLVATVLRADLGFEYKIKFYTDAVNYSILTANTQIQISNPTEATYSFAWFNLSNGNYFLDGLSFNIFKVGVVNFSNIGAIEFDINSGAGVADVDLTLDSITKRGVPEPGSLALVSLALLGLGAAARNSRKA